MNQLESLPSQKREGKTWAEVVPVEWKEEAGRRNSKVTEATELVHELDVGARR